jgi:hypothetical protein
VSRVENAVRVDAVRGPRILGFGRVRIEKLEEQLGRS